MVQYISTSIRFHAALLHLQPQQAGLWTADRLSIVPILAVESIAAFIKGIYLRLTLLFFVGVLCQAIWDKDKSALPHRRHSAAHTLNGTLYQRSARCL